MELVKVKNHENLSRDPFTNGIVNTNKSQYDEYIARRESVEKEKEKSSNMEEDLANLKGEINEIKSLLKELVRGN